MRLSYEALSLLKMEFNRLGISRRYGAGEVLEEAYNKAKDDGYANLEDWDDREGYDDVINAAFDLAVSE